MTSHSHQCYTNDELIRAYSMSSDPLVRLLVERWETETCNKFDPSSPLIKELLIQMEEYCDELEQGTENFESCIERLRDRPGKLKQNLGNKP